MLLSRVDRWAFRLILGALILIILVLGLPYGWSLYQTHLRRELMDAAKTGDVARLKTLLRKGTDPNVTLAEIGESHGSPQSGTTCLEVALQNGHSEAALALLRSGAKVNSNNVALTDRQGNLQVVSNDVALADQREDRKVVLARTERGFTPEKALRSMTGENTPLLRALL